MPTSTLPPIRLVFLISSVAMSGLPLLADEYRATSGLQALYDFSGEGNTIRDQSGAKIPIDLTIATPNSVTRSNGQLHILDTPVIRSDKPPKRLIEAVKASGELTVEAWCQPANTKQNGPARLVTISKDSVNRNVTLGQDGSKYEARLRTTRTSANGIPSVPAPDDSANTELAHVVYTHAKDGTTRIFVNGKPVIEKNVPGKLSNWNSSYRIAIGDELSGGRPWLGNLHLVAIYSRSLTAKEVIQNFDAGSDGKPSPELIAQRKRQAAARTFETAVAPIIAKHCLECHDSANHANGLDLSKKVAAFKGGANGRSIFPGHAEESEFWTSIEADLMPQDRPPLSPAEKSIIKSWINDGAVWTLSEIDPAIYTHSGRNQNFVQRLTVDEYIETVRTVTAVDIQQEARELLPTDLRADGFSNTAYNLNVDLKHIDAYAKLAEIIVSRMDVKPFVKKFSNRRKFTDKDMADVISKLGKWVLRGPVDEREIIAYRGITTTVASAGGDFDEAMEFVIEAMLQSPRFIYRVESQRGGGSVPASEFELASRMSYIIWGGPPDAELLKLADEETLSDQIEAQAKRMLNDDRARKQALRFITDWLNLNRLHNLRPNIERFPDWNAELAEDMRQETLAFFEEVIWSRQQPLSALLNSQYTFATPGLAKFYGLKKTIQSAQTDSAPRSRFQLSAWRPAAIECYDLTDVPGRGGLLTQGSVLTVGCDDASMVTRGLLVMHELLRGVVKDPPPCVDTTPIPTKPGLTQRSIAMERIANNSCGGCHSKFEPLAFGLEKFDGLGAYHDEDEHGNRLRDDGEILVPGSAKSVKYDSAAELMNLLANSDRVSQSFTWKITQFALGRPLVAEDAAIVDRIHTTARQNGSTWKAVMTAIVESDLVRNKRTEE